MQEKIIPNKKGKSRALQGSKSGTLVKKVNPGL
jgi:hypothetical protein